MLDNVFDLGVQNLNPPAGSLRSVLHCSHCEHAPISSVSTPPRASLCPRQSDDSLVQRVGVVTEVGPST